jgi:phage baseplate assembly protein W
MGFIDTFSGANLDPAAWEANVVGANTISIVGGRLNLHATSGSMVQPGMAGVLRRAALTGDFSLVVDLDATITLGPALPFGWAVIVLGALDESPEIIGLFKFGALDLVLAHVRVQGGIGGVGAIQLTPGITRQAARLRITRSGSTWRTEADLLDGSGYRSMSQIDGSTADVQSMLLALCCGNPVEAFFDNYLENAAPVDQPSVVTSYLYPNLGCDLLLDADGDLSVSVTGDLALTPRGSVCLLQDIADLLETLPGDLFGHPDYGAGIGRLFGENYKAGFVRHVERAVRDALVNDPSVAPRLLPETVQVDMERYSERELSVAINVSAISDGQIVPLNFVWQYGLDEVSRIFTREAAR